MNRSAPRPPAAMRRGWCPSTLRPMPSGDGWLVRLHPPGARFSPEQLAAVAALAARHGNGLVEISARANLQLRGVTAESHGPLVEALLAAGLVDEQGEGPARITLASPLPRMAAGALVDGQALAEAIEAAGRCISGLPPKTLVAIDDGGALPPPLAGADLGLLALAPDRFCLRLPGGQWRGPMTQRQAIEAISRLLVHLAAAHRAHPDRIRRLRDLAPRELPLDAPPHEAPASRRPRQRVGLFGHGDIALVALPFGRTDSATLAALAETAPAGAAIRPTPWRGLSFGGLGPGGAESLLAQSGSLGLITGEGDPRLAVQACPGTPACRSGEAPAMADAARIAAAAAPFLAGGFTLHVSGCEKSCAHPGRADLTLCGRDGRYDVIPAGGTRDPAVATLDLSAVLARLRRGEYFTRSPDSSP